MTGFEWPLEMLLNTNLSKEVYLFWKKWGEMTELAQKLVHKIYLSHKILHVVVGLFFVQNTDGKTATVWWREPVNVGTIYDGVFTPHYFI